MTNYQDMNSETLNRAVAEALGWEYGNGVPGFKYKTGVVDPSNRIEEEAYDIALEPGEIWDPCHNANQIQEYLWPVLPRQKVKLSMVYGGANLFWIAYEIWEDSRVIAKDAFSCEDPKDINKTQVIAWLSAMKELSK